MNLSDLYDADKRARDVKVRWAANNVRIPHPLSRVQYADGLSPATAGREVRSLWINERDS